MKDLLSNINSSVRVWAATHLLNVIEREAVDVLEEVSKENSIIGLNAKTVIKEWKAGRLKVI